MQGNKEIKSFLHSVAMSGIRSRQRRVRKFDKSSLKTIVLSLDGGVLGVTGCLLGEQDRKIQTIIFNKSSNPYGVRVWTLKKAKTWLTQYKRGIRKIVNPEKVVNKIYIGKMVENMEKALMDKLPKAITKILEA
jgi:hypothetical protein